MKLLRYFALGKPGWYILHLIAVLLLLWLGAKINF